MSSIDLAADRAIIEAATPGPWYARATDDERSMNARYVSTYGFSDRGCLDLEHDNVQGMNPRSGNRTKPYDVVSITLLQSPPLALAYRCDENTVFIAAARTRWPAALDEIERLREEVLRLKMLAESEAEDAVDQVVYESQDYVDRQRAEIERLRAARDVLAVTLSEFNNKLNTARATIAEREATIGEQNAEIDSLRSLAWEMAESACERGQACDANFDTAVEIARCMRKLRSVKEATIGELRAALEPFAKIGRGIAPNWPGQCVLYSREDQLKGRNVLAATYHEESLNGFPTIDDYRKADALLAKTAPAKEGT